MRTCKLLLATLLVTISPLAVAQSEPVSLDELLQKVKAGRVQDIMPPFNWMASPTNPETI